MARRNDAKTDTIAARAFKARCLELMDHERTRRYELRDRSAVFRDDVLHLLLADPTADRRIVDYARREKKVALSVVEAR